MFKAYIVFLALLVCFGFLNFYFAIYPKELIPAMAHAVIAGFDFLMFLVLLLQYEDVKKLAK